MNKESLEHLSSLMDGEMSRETGLFVTRRLSSDDELSATWTRYHLIRDCLKQPGGGAAVPDFSMRVQQALTDEPIRQAAPGRPAWLRPVAGFAIAASVALVAIVAVNPQGQPGPQTGAETVVNTPFSSPNTINTAPASQPVSFSPQLNSYLLRHNQLARTAGRQGFVSFVPMMSAQAAASTEVLAVERADETAAGQESAENTEQ